MIRAIFGQSESSNLARKLAAAGVVALVVLAAALAIYFYCKPKQDPTLPVVKGPRLAATCLDTGHSSIDDPIFDDQPRNQRHLHIFYGNKSTKQHSTYESLLKAKTKCKQEEDRSAWWIPAARWKNGDRYFDLEPPKKLVIYYQVTHGIDPEKIDPFPPGFEAVARNPQFRQCGDSDGNTSSSSSAAITFSTNPPVPCPNGSIAIRLDFGQCLDPGDPDVGTNLTTPIASTDSRTDDGQECPTSHSVLLPQIQLQANYRVPDEVDETGELQVMTTEGWKDAKTGAHADFINVWDQERLSALVTLCLEDIEEKEERPGVCRTKTGAV